MRLLLKVLIVLFINGFYVAAFTQVTVNEEELLMPAYPLGPDEPNPLFKDYTLPGFEVFRGDRSVYPYTLLNKFSHESEPKKYLGIKLENEFIKTWIIPELRGRMQGAVDKRNGWDFIYFNNSIKPADIAVRMAWISGGLEWNHPGGHGYTQFNKIPYEIKHYDDGSISVIVSEIEPVRQMKWETEIKLSPGKLYVETIGRISSIAPYPVPFASSLNGAMHTSEELEIIYPKGSYYTGHGKKSLHKWPYYKDVDVSRLKNTMDVFSVFVEGEGLFHDYWGCYSHDRDIDAGTVIVSDYRFAPGKKYFTWGAHDKAKLWDTFLSDEDGGYIELQVQAFWDNLGYGYALLDPLEVKEFNVFWYPVLNMGGFVSATRDACLNIKEQENGELEFIIQATDLFRKSKILITSSDKLIYSDEVDLTPEKNFKGTVFLDEPFQTDPLSFVIKSADDAVLLEYSTERSEKTPPELPVHHSDPGKMSVDQLYAKGKSWYQDPFGNEAEHFYKLMLDRDSLESRANRELGLLYYHRNQLDTAIHYLQQSLVNDHLNNAYTTYYYLGLISFDKRQLDQAERYFSISIRKKELFVPSARYLGRIALVKKRFDQSENYYSEAMRNGAIHPLVWVEQAIALRKAGKADKAQIQLDKALHKNVLSFDAIAESWLLSGGADNTNATKYLNKIFDRDDDTFVGSQLYLTIAGNYLELGLYEDALRIVKQAISYYKSKGKAIYPMLYYYAGYCYGKLNETIDEMEMYSRAGAMQPTYVFPYLRSDFLVLEQAQKNSPSGFVPNLLLGNINAYYRQHEAAIKYWEQALNANPDYSVTYHNLAGAYWAVHNSVGHSIELLEKALRIKPGDTRIILELDHLYQYKNLYNKRLDIFEKHLPVVNKNDDLVLRYAKLCIALEKFDTAIELMTNHHFFPREANHMQPLVITVYSEAHIGKGIQYLENGMYSKAVEHFKLAKEFPDKLNDILPEKAVFTRLHYYTGLALKGAGNMKDAVDIWNKALSSETRTGYECDVYKALILKQLDRKRESVELLNRMIEENKKVVKGDSDIHRKAVSYYVLHRSHQELGNDELSKAFLEKALEADREAMIKTRIESAHIPLIRN